MATIDGQTTYCPVEGRHGTSITRGMTEDEMKGLEAERARLNVANTASALRARVVAEGNGHLNGHKHLAAA